MSDPNVSRSVEFYCEENFRRDLWFEVAARDYEALIEAADFAGVLGQGGRLLDVGCGSGKFPALLAAALTGRDGVAGCAGAAAVEYDFLDASDYCVAQLADRLQMPFRAGTGMVSRIEDLAWPVNGGEAPMPYDLVWAIHSCYAWDRGRLQDSLARLTGRLAPGGGILVYQAAADAAYHRIYDAYITHFGQDLEGYVTAEQILAAIEPDHGAVMPLRFDHVIAADRRKVLENYIQQICLDRTLTLDEFMDNPGMGGFLESFRRDGEYVFPQEVHLIGTPALLQRLFTGQEESRVTPIYIL